MKRKLHELQNENVIFYNPIYNLCGLDLHFITDVIFYTPMDNSYSKNNILSFLNGIQRKNMLKVHILY